MTNEHLVVAVNVKAPVTSGDIEMEQSGIVTTSNRMVDCKLLSQEIQSVRNLCDA